jgi:hypothetical protein
MARTARICHPARSAAVRAARLTKPHEASSEVAGTRLLAHVHSTTKRATATSDDARRKRPYVSEAHASLVSPVTFVQRSDGALVEDGVFVLRE